MRSLMLPAASLIAAMTVMAAPAEAQMHGVATVNQLSDLLNQIEQLNMRRPRDEFQANIARQIEMVRNRFQDALSRRMTTPQALMLADEGLYNIQQYNYNGSAQVPPRMAERMEGLVAEMRGIIANRKGGWHGPPMRGPGYGYHMPPPAPAQRYPVVTQPQPQPVYTPPPAPPVYAPRPAPPTYVPPPPPAPSRRNY